MMKLSASGKLIVPAGKKEERAAAANPASPVDTPASKPPPARPGTAPGNAPAAAQPVAPKINWNEMPEIEIVTAADLERVRVETEAKRRREMIGMFKIGAYGFLGVLVLALGFEAIRYFLNARPSEELLQPVREEVAAQVLRQFTSGEQPLEIDSIATEELDRGRTRIDYELRVTLKLRVPIYGPADSNGAQPYLALQRSLADAQALVLQQRLFLHEPELAAAPNMPLLIAITHRAGERRVVRVPLTATRTMWSWRLQPQVDRTRPLGPGFTGQALSRYAETPYLIFGTTEARDPMRKAMAAARKFILDANAAYRAASAARQGD